MTSLVERELLHYWRAAKAVRVLRRVPGAADMAADAEAELAAVAQHSEWPRLRTAAQKMLDVA